MEMIRDGDSTTQITFTIITTFEYASQVALPLDITLNEQPLPTDGSISWLAPAHPVSLLFSGDSVETQNIPLWWNNGDDVVSVTLEEIEVKEPTVIENAIDWATHPIAFIIYLGIIAVLMTMWMRHQNKIDFDVEDDENEDSDEDDIELVEKPESLDDGLEDTPQVKAKRTPPPSKRKMYNTSTENESLVKKKRVSSQELNKDGPIMKTKRKRLDSVEQKTVTTDKNVVTGKKKLVKTSEPVIKKRKVKTVKDEVTEPEPEKKKKRKSVKRKKKSSSEKKIDEEKMQENLANDFLKEE